MMHTISNEVKILCLVFGYILCHSSYVWCFIESQNIPDEAFIRLGDLNIGGLVSTRDNSGIRDDPCSGEITRLGQQQDVQSIVYAIDEINTRSDILPNITLGFVIIDDCRYGITAMAKATKFLPVAKCVRQSCKHSPGEYPTYYDVIGVVGGQSSSMAVLISRLLGIYNIPLVSPTASSDELSDDFNHAYFFRVVPPNHFQTNAILSIFEHFNWTYFTILYSAGSYGSNLYRELYKLATNQGLCIGYYEELHLEMTMRDYDRIVRNLRKFRKAKAVVLFLFPEQQQQLFSAIRRAQAGGEFMWLGGDSLDMDFFVGYEEEALGAISITFPITYIPKLENYFLQLNAMNNPGNPWYSPLWQNIFQCTWEKSSFNTTHCSNFPSISQADGYYFSSWTSKIVDSVYVYGHALHNLISDQCPEAYSDKTLLEGCITRPMLRKYLQRVSFQGTTGYIEFNQEGDLMGDFVIKQFVRDGSKYGHKDIGDWVYSGSELHLYNVSWYMKNESNALDTSVPESVCSKPCGVGEIVIQGEVSCCWDCHKCWKNQYAADGHTKCYDCPDLTWPDPDTKTECLPISPTYLQWTDILGISLTVLDVVGLCFLLIITSLILIYSDRVIMKASSIPLSSVIIIGLYMAFVTSLVLKLRPITASCSIGHVGFHMSCTVLYGTMCTKTCRIYRLFRASKRLQRAGIMMSTPAQLIMIAGIIGIQVILLLAAVVVQNMVFNSHSQLSQILMPSIAEQYMPVRTEEFVELRCDRSKLVLLTPFSFNLFILLLCAVFAFLTRHLPDGFNESWYIFLSVTTTLIIWMAFIPTYFITFYAYHREALLSLALSLNACCNMICFFVPKVYALFWVKDDNIETGFKDESMEIKMSKKNTRVN